MTNNHINIVTHLRATCTDAEKAPPEAAPTALAGLVGIAAVERDTGLGKDTLRVWEKRYGFPLPVRDDLGERLYPPEQVERLREIKRLMDSGHRPAQVVPLEINELRALAPQRASRHRPLAQALPPSTHPGLSDWMQLVLRHQMADFKQALRQTLLEQGLLPTLSQTVAPLNAAVGEAWMRGELAVFEEHLYTDALQSVLRQWLVGRRNDTGGGSPRVLLTTPVGEPHGLGLLMAECVLAEQGCECLSLGPQTPVPDLVQAATRLRADVVALGFSASQNARRVRSTLDEASAALANGMELWVGGLAPVVYRSLERRPAPGCWPMPTLEQLAAQPTRWRQSHG